MANASQAIKDLAGYEAPSNAEDGVAHIIYQLLKQTPLKTDIGSRLCCPNRYYA